MLNILQQNRQYLYIKQNYTGEVLVAAENAEEATTIIKNFQKSDSNNKKEKNIYLYIFKV